MRKILLVMTKIPTSSTCQNQGTEQAVWSEWEPEEQIMHLLHMQVIVEVSNACMLLLAIQLVEGLQNQI